MIKKTITFENFDGVTITQDFYFHVAKHELVTLKFSAPGADFEAYVRRLMQTEDNKAIIAMFKDFVSMSYGRRNAEGGFEKDEVWTRAFVGSNAFDELVMEFFTDAGSAGEFVNGILPKALVTEAQKQGLLKDVQLPEPTPVVKDGGTTERQEALSRGIAWDIDNNQPAWITEGRVPTKKEIMAATPEEIVLAMGRRTGAQEIRKEE